MPIVIRRALTLAAFVFFALSGLVAPITAHAAEFTGAQKKEIETIVRDYLVNNPEVLREAISELERRAKAEETEQRSAALAGMSASLYDSKNQTVIGNPNGKITLVEFFDYNCGYCKKAMTDVTRLIKENPDLRIVLKDFPVLGPSSLEVAQVASAARNQIKGDKYWDFHQKLLLTRGTITKVQAVAIAKEFGADPEKLEKDITMPDVKAGIKEVMNMADQLSLTGTPSWVIGQEVVVGAVGYDELRDKIENMRKCGKAVCS